LEEAGNSFIFKCQWSPKWILKQINIQSPERDYLQYMSRNKFQVIVYQIALRTKNIINWTKTESFRKIHKSNKCGKIGSVC
jgi:hypothetical protein